MIINVFPKFKLADSIIIIIIIIIMKQLGSHHLRLLGKRIYKAFLIPIIDRLIVLVVCVSDY